MIIVKKSIGDGLEAEVRLDDETEFYIPCLKCGRPIKATEDIWENFAGYLSGECGIICEMCSTKKA